VFVALEIRRRRRVDTLDNSGEEFWKSRSQKGSSEEIFAVTSWWWPLVEYECQKRAEQLLPIIARMGRFYLGIFDHVLCYLCSINSIRWSVSEWGDRETHHLTWRKPHFSSSEVALEILDFAYLQNCRQTMSCLRIQHRHPYFPLAVWLLSEDALRNIKFLERPLQLKWLVEWLPEDALNGSHFQGITRTKQIMKW
jgi:hypothetical protein